MHPSPVQPPPPPSSHAPSQTYDVPIKTEERVRPIPALQQQQQQQQQPQQRVQRYKDKFQSLRERYENVISSHTEYSRAVQRATEKEQRLQAEINMLLDAALATSPQSQLPSASTPIPAAATATTSTTPTPVHAQLSPLEPHAVVPASLAPVPVPAPAPAHMNGHSSSAAPPPHVHAHLHGHGYVANHTPSAVAPTPERAADPPLL